MSYIYKITNKTNNKVYIGKTDYTIEKRWKEHCSDRFRYQERPLYRAINKYGEESFYIELVEECNSELSSEKEIYWINFYNSYKNGYNATLGGEGAQTINHSLIIESYLELKNCKLVANKFNICQETVRDTLHSNNIEVFSSSIVNQINKKKVEMYSKDLELIMTFPSVESAGKYIDELKNINRSKQHIREVCLGKRKTAYGFVWKYANMEV